MLAVNMTVISGLCWSLVSAMSPYSPSATSAVDATNQYGLLITISGVDGDFSQTVKLVIYFGV